MHRWLTVGHILVTLVTLSPGRSRDGQGRAGPKGVRSLGPCAVRLDLNDDEPVGTAAMPRAPLPSTDGPL
jgi:hypothetical protein